MTARIVASARQIGAARWNALANPGGAADPHPFTTYEFFAALEESGSATARTGWQPAHLLLEDNPPRARKRMAGEVTVAGPRVSEGRRGLKIWG